MHSTVRLKRTGKFFRVYFNCYLLIEKVTMVEEHRATAFGMDNDCINVKKRLEFQIWMDAVGINHKEVEIKKVKPVI